MFATPGAVWAGPQIHLPYISSNGYVGWDIDIPLGMGWGWERAVGEFRKGWKFCCWGLQLKASLLRYLARGATKLDVPIHPDTWRISKSWRPPLKYFVSHVTMSLSGGGV